MEIDMDWMYKYDNDKQNYTYFQLKLLVEKLASLNL